MRQPCKLNYFELNVSSCAIHVFNSMSTNQYSRTGNPGTVTMFDGLDPGLYTLTVTATRGSENKKVQWRIYIPPDETYCSVNFINEGLVVSGSSIKVEFTAVGDEDVEYKCKFNGNLLRDVECKS